MSEWVSSSHSSGDDAKLELMPLEDGSWLMRNSREPSAALHFTGPEMAAWLSGVKAGEFDGAC